MARLLWQAIASLVYLKTIMPVGVIDSDVSLPITNTIANMQEYANYTFRFNVTTKLIQGGYVQITFPLQFESGLGIPFLPNCTVTCTRKDRSVNLYFSEDLFPALSKVVITSLQCHGLQRLESQLDRRHGTVHRQDVQRRKHD